MPVVKEYYKKLYTPLGKAQADLIWVPDTDEEPSMYHCWQNETNEVWWWPQQLVRQVESFTGIRHGIHSEIFVSTELLKTYAEAILRHKKSPFYEKAKRILKVKRSKQNDQAS